MDTKEAIQEVNKRIFLAERSTIFVNAILDYAEKHEGKQINRRIISHLKNKFPEYTINFHLVAGMKCIEVWGNGIDYKERLPMLICYDHEKTYNPEIIKERLYADWLDRDRLIKYKKAIPEVPKWIKRHDKIINALENLENEMDEYELRCLIK